jgi:hypothetical protein
LFEEGSSQRCEKVSVNRREKRKEEKEDDMGKNDE